MVEQTGEIQISGSQYTSRKKNFTLDIHHDHNSVRKLTIIYNLTTKQNKKERAKTHYLQFLHNRLHISDRP